jgi:hypothetical protein
MKKKKGYNINIRLKCTYFGVDGDRGDSTLRPESYHLKPEQS